MLFDKLDIKNPAEDIYVLWSYLGIIPPKNPAYKLVYFVYSALVNILSTFYIPVSLVLQLLQYSTFDEYCEFGYIVIVIVLNNFKFICLIYIKTQIKDILKDVDRLTNRANSRNQGPILYRWVYLGKKFSKTLLVTTLLCLLFMELNVLFGFGQPQVLPAWYPFEIPYRSFIYWMIHIYQIIGCIYLIFMFTASNTLLVIYICFYIGHVKCLAQRVRFIGYDKILTLRENEVELKECMRDHQKLLE